MSVEQTAGPILAGLRRARGRQQTLVRTLELLAPLLLCWLVVSVYFARPAPAFTGAGLVISGALAVFVIAVFGRRTTAVRPRGMHLVWVGLILTSAVTLAWAQPAGPGAECVLLGVLCVARLLPVRAAVPVLVLTFVAAVTFGAVAHRDDLVVLAAIAAVYGMLYLAWLLSEANKRAERLLTDLHHSRQAQAEAAGLAERQRLAREMHDVLAHSLSGLILQLEGARMLVSVDPTDPRLAQAVERAHHLGRSGLEEARRAIATLRDDDLPGPDRIAGLAAEFAESRGVPCTLVVRGEPRTLGSETGLAFYRVAQEALTNIVKHATAERVDLCLDYGPATTRLIVEDVEEIAARSSGRSAEQPPAGLGYGLTGMRERAELLGGTLTAAATSRGFRVELEVPA